MNDEQMKIDYDRPQPDAMNYAPTEGMTEIELKVIGLIQRGRANAISMPALASAVGISTRELQSIIQALINDRGVLIASATGKNHGYYIPETAEEHKAATDQLKHRIISLARRIRAIDKTAYEEIFGQGRMDLEL